MLENWPMHSEQPLWPAVGPAFLGLHLVHRWDLETASSPSTGSVACFCLGGAGAAGTFALATGLAPAMAWVMLLRSRLPAWIWTLIRGRGTGT